jgi:hypothetical protein
MVSSKFFTAIAVAYIAASQIGALAAAYSKLPYDVEINYTGTVNIC